MHHLQLIMNVTVVTSENKHVGNSDIVTNLIQTG